jgi:hypothetical protein
MVSVATISIFLGMLPSMTPFSIDTEIKESSYLVNKTDSKQDAASSAVEDVLPAMDCTIMSIVDPGFKKSSLYCCTVQFDGMTISMPF